jgi:hypothetical protein
MLDGRRSAPVQQLDLRARPNEADLHTFIIQARGITEKNTSESVNRQQPQKLKRGYFTSKYKNCSTNLNLIVSTQRRIVHCSIQI